MMYVYFSCLHIQILSTERSYGGSCLCYDVIMILTDMLCLCLLGHIIKSRQEAESQDQGVNLQHKRLVSHAARMLVDMGCLLKPPPPQGSRLDFSQSVHIYHLFPD